MPPRHNKTPPSRRDSPASQREKDAETFGSSPSHAKRLLATALEDCEFRFIMNLPESELKSPERLFFQIEQVRGTVVGLRHCAFGTGTVFERRSRERFTRPFLPYHPFQAHWYYEDFLADAPNSGLPHISSLKQFGQKLFAHSDVLDPDLFDDCFANFMAYKGQIPTYGCILVNPNMTHMLLVRNWKGTSWGFPKGKLNEGVDGGHLRRARGMPPPPTKKICLRAVHLCAQSGVVSAHLLLFTAPPRSPLSRWRRRSATALRSLRTRAARWFSKAGSAAKCSSWATPPRTSRTSLSPGRKYQRYGPSQPASQPLFPLGQLFLPAFFFFPQPRRQLV